MKINSGFLENYIMKTRNTEFRRVSENDDKEIISLFQLATSVGIKLNAGMMNALKEEEALGPQRQIFGFLR